MYRSVLAERRDGRQLCSRGSFPCGSGVLPTASRGPHGSHSFKRLYLGRRDSSVANPAGNFFVLLFFAATTGTVFACLAAAGEEIGWRGYMLTRLIDAGVPRPVLVSGLIWAAFHLPLILSGQYAAGAHPRISALVFVGTVVAGGYITAYVRLQSGSVWPAVLFHGAWNAIIQGAFDPSTVGKPLAVGESGYIVAAVGLLTVAWLWSTIRWPMLRSPGEPINGAG